MVFALGPASGQKDREGILPPAPPVWEFQEQMSALAAELNRSLGLTGLPARLLRATLLDKSIYRETTLDETLKMESWAICLAAISVGVVLMVMLSFSITGIFAAVPAIATKLLVWLTRIWAIQVAIRRLLNVPLHFQQVFRAIVYAQAILVLSPMPYLGWLLVVCAAVSTTAAIRDISGAETPKAFLANLAGVAGALFVSQFVVPVLLRLV
jgi:hypothetical protein